MDLSPLQRKVSPEEIPLDRLAANKALSPAQKISQSCRHFEGMLVRQILGDAMKTTHASKLLPESGPSKIYKDLMTETLADRIGKSGQFGIASALEAQLTAGRSSSRQVSKAAPSMPAETPPNQPPPLGEATPKKPLQPAQPAKPIPILP